ncbi:MAG: sensor histidine kinase [Bacteroidota bacterium]
MTDNSKLEMIRDENKQLKNRIKKLENFLNSSNAELIKPTEDPGLLTSDYFNVMTRDYMYRILIENMNEGALIVNERKIIVYSNKHFAGIIDLPLQKTMGGDFYSLFDEKERMVLEECFSTAETGKEFCEVIIKTGSAEKIPVLVSIVTFLLEAKRYYCVIVNDISDHTEIKQGLETKIEKQMQELAVANKRLAGVNRELNDANQYLDNIVHTIAHDLRAPLSNLMLVDELLQVATDNQRDKLMKSVHNNVHKLDKILKGLVEILKVQGVKEESRPGISVMNVINEILEEKEYQIKKKNAKITIRGREDYEINYIEVYLKSIIRNLLSNAVKYSKDVEEPEIIIEMNKTSRFFILSIEDKGVGFDLKKEGKDLFKPFHRITSEGTGMGIGLHIINDMIKKNGGHIEVESKLGKGSKFTVFLKEYNP